MLIHRWDQSLDEREWRTFLAEHPFGDLVATGRNRDLAVVVPTQFVLDGDEVVIHLARPNPIWAAIDENDQVMVCVAGDWAFIPSSWKALRDEDPRLGIPTTYYASVQLVGTARMIDEVDGVAGLLRQQLAVFQPTEDVVDPADHGVRLRAIRGLRIAVSDVRAKFKFGGNVDEEHRVAVAARLHDRNGPGDTAALMHLRRRIDGPTD